MNIITDSTGYVKTLAGEMLNLEKQKKIFVSGKYQEPSIKSKTGELIHPAYKDIEIDGVKTLITPVYGMLYVDCDLQSEFESNLQHAIETLELKIPRLTAKYNSNYAPVETGYHGFTSLKLETLYTKRTATYNTIRVKARTLEGSERAIFITDQYQIHSYEEFLGIARFTWIVLHISHLISDIVRRCLEPVPYHIQHYLSIVYDPNNIFSQQCSTTPLITDFTCLKNYQPISSYGTFTLEQLRELYKTFKAENRVNPITIDYEQTSISQRLNDTWHKTVKSLYFNEYVPNPNPHYSLNYSEKFFGAKELIKQLGRGHHIEDLVSHQYKFVPVTVETYEALFDKIEITNTDRCFACKTPLYDDIYVTAATHDLKACTAFCYVCMHSHTHTLDDGSILFRQGGNNLLAGGKMLVRTKYPRTRDQVIDMVTDSTVREIIRSMYSKNNTIITVSGTKHLFLNCTVESMQSNTLLDSKIFVGVSDFATFIQYYHQQMAGEPSYPSFIGANPDLFKKHSIIFSVTIGK